MQHLIINGKEYVIIDNVMIAHDDVTSLKYNDVTVKTSIVVPPETVKVLSVVWSPIVAVCVGNVYSVVPALLTIDSVSVIVSEPVGEDIVRNCGITTWYKVILVSLAGIDNDFVVNVV